MNTHEGILSTKLPYTLEWEVNTNDLPPHGEYLSIRYVTRSRNLNQTYTPSKAIAVLTGSKSPPFPISILPESVKAEMLLAIIPTDAPK